MFYCIIIIFEFFILVKISFGIQYCKIDNTGLDCHDGGCSYREPGSTAEKCVCEFSIGVMNGKTCGNYEDQCNPENPCENDGTCSSGIGHPICECPDDVYGNNCEKFTSKLHM